MLGEIRLNKVSTHNLKQLDVCFPLGKVSVVTGVSGSGKSSLVFDTLYSESYRRYVESLSGYARQYLQALPKPALESAGGLPPAVAVQQYRASGDARSTVGSLTELNELLALLFAAEAKLLCTACGNEVIAMQAEEIAKRLIADHSATNMQIASPLRHLAGLGVEQIKSDLAQAGFNRLLCGNVILPLSALSASSIITAHVLIDRLSPSGANLSRLTEAVGLALKLGNNELLVRLEAGGELRFSSVWRCLPCQRNYQVPSPSLFNYNHPLGACSACEGFGREALPDWQKAISKLDASLASHGVDLWNFGPLNAYYDYAAASIQKRQIKLETPFSAYSEEDWQWLRDGDARGPFSGLQGALGFLEKKRYKAHYRIFAARFRRYEPCRSCKGQRFAKASLAVTLGNLSIYDALDLTARELSLWLSALDVPRSAHGLDARQELQQRLNYMLRLGLAHLSGLRTARTLAGGELQRIKLARCLGSGLSGTLYCLDEPSAGLHAQDSAKLWGLVDELCESGNTVVIVEHEWAFIERADYLLCLGPEGGRFGGQLTYSGPPQAAAKNLAVPWQFARLASGAEFIELSGARLHNLRGVNARFPVGKITAVCGLSGSGKSSLIAHCLFPLLARALGQEVSISSGHGAVGPQALIEQHEAVVLVAQAPLVRSSRSTLLSYLGLMDELRTLMAKTPEAIAAKLSPSAFSFNVPGGRCETCKGLGVVEEDLSFLGELNVVCSACAGQRFNDKVLAIRWCGLNLLEILRLTVVEASELFAEYRKIRHVLAQVTSLGLGYLSLGQDTSSLSGGEAQRLKLLRYLPGGRRTKLRPTILLFDEPTTGLSDQDVHELLKQLQKLCFEGHTVIVIEHHLGVIGSADWVVELGPGAAAEGGTLVFAGAPLHLCNHNESLTAPYLRRTMYRNNNE